MVAPDALEGLEVYLVGGAVRDEVLGLPVQDRDWVVVGATPQEMESRGFKPVGQDFPVFLHPDTKEEYALARTERKTGPGYKGFEFSTSADITLDQDLRRRDLTINAMARAPDGTLIDPYGGRADLEQRVLRHVSEAFAEDPVRILRVARLRARFGFDIAPETWGLMRSMVERGEVDALVAERTWQELRSALEENRPSMFFETLRECGALARVMPEIDALFGVPQRAYYHPEIDAGVHTMMVVDQAARLSDDPAIRFAALLHDLGKAVTPPEQLPSHRGHERTGLDCINELCARLRVPRAYRDLALAACETHLKLHRIAELKTATVLALLERLDVFRRPQRFYQVLAVAEADARGRLGLESRPYPQAQIARDYLHAAEQVDAAAVARQCADGAETASRLRQLRGEAIDAVRRGRNAEAKNRPAT